MKRTLLLALVLVISLGLISATESSSIDDIPTSSVSKITEELQEKLDQLENDDNVSIYIWTADIDYEAVEDEVESITGFREESFQTDANEMYSERSEEERDELSQNVDSYIMTKREISSREYGILNTDFVENHIPNANIIFQSQFAPMIIAEVTKADVFRLAELEDVWHLDLYVEFMFE
jgi:hypothetical protein